MNRCFWVSWVFGIVSLLSFSSWGSAVLWNAITLEQNQFQEIHLVTGGESPFFVMFGVKAESSASGIKITANPEGCYLMSFMGGWLEAAVGDIVNASSLLGLSRYFVDGILGQETAVEVPVAAKVGESNYLKFVVQDSNQCFDYQDGVRMDMPDCYYGWLEYSVTEDGRITVLQSAIGLEGQSMTVGATPEPSSAVLLLLGCVGLLLKRSRIAIHDTST